MANILLIEDEFALAQQWTILLTENDHNVVHCIDVDRALKALDEQWPDVIILDFFFRTDASPMRREGGLLFLRELYSQKYKGKEKLPPVVGVTGALPDKYFPDDIFESANSIRPGALARQLRKPFAAETLLREVTALLAAPQH